MNDRSWSSWLSHYGAAVFASLAIVAQSVYIVWEDWQAARTEAEVSVLNTARMLAADLDRSFDQIDAWLRAVGERQAQTRPSDAEDVRRFQEQLKREVKLQPLIARLGISDAQGRVFFNTGTDQPLDIADRDSFQRARAGESGPIFSDPLHSPVTGEWVVVMARRLEDAAGHFTGVVQAALPIEAIGRNFQDVDLGTQGVINLRLANLAQVVRWPALSGPDQGPGNQNISQTVLDLLRKFPDRSSFAYLTTPPIDGIERVYAYQRFKHHPFSLFVGRATADFGAGWRQTAVLLAALSLTTSMALLWFARRLRRQNQGLERLIAARTGDLAEREHFLHTLTDALPSLIGYWDAGLRNRFANRAYLEWFGKTPAEMSGMPLPDLLGADRFARCEPMIRAALRGEPQSFKGRMTRADGRHRRTWSHFIPDQRGDEVPGFFVLVTDITEIKQAKAENARLRRILDESPDFIGMADLEGNPCYLNAAAKGLIGLAPDADLGQSHLSDLYPVWASRRIARTGIPTAIEQDVWIGESTVQRHDGRKIPVSQIILVHRNERGRPERLSTIIRDISDQTRQAAALAKARRTALAASKAKGAFLANMSHEIRTPLNAVLGMAYLLEQSPLEPEQRDKLGKIQTAGRALLELVNDVLDLSKIEAGEIELERIAFSPAALFDELLALVAQQATSKGLALEFAPLPADLPAALVGDPHRLRQVLLNLLNNAVKFTARGAVSLRADLLDSPRDEAVRLRFEITDTGVGIPAEALPTLFTPFTQADSSTTRRFGGSGLGLSIVRQFAERMGGVVGVASQAGQGSTFWVELPFALAPTPAMTAASVPPPDAKYLPGQRHLQGVRVLLVDDSDTNLEIAAAILEREGALISTCLNGADALDFLRTPGNQVDIVLMDVQMPMMDGNTAVRALRRDPALSTLPVVALTAGALSSERDKALAAGMDDFLTKPFDPRRMVEVLCHQVERVRGAPLPQGPSRDARPDPADHWPLIAGIDAEDAKARLDGDLELFTTSLRRFLAEFGDWRAAPPLLGDGGLAAQVAPATPVAPAPRVGPEAPTMPATGESPGTGGTPTARQAREALAGHLHKLAGGAGQLGAATIHRLAKEAEKHLLAGGQGLDGLETLLIALADHLAALARAATPHLEAAAQARKERDSAGAGPSDPTQQIAALAELKAHLTGRRMAALALYQQLAPALRGTLSVDDFSHLDAAIECLDFKTALAVLER